MFTATRTGFQITFVNGWTASVQWGEGNYCSTRHDQQRAATTVELAAFRDGEWHEFESGHDIEGWCSPARVLAFLNEVAAKPGRNE